VLVLGCAAVLLVAADLEHRLPAGVNGVRSAPVAETVSG
jgi:hypothetical protein